MFFSDKKKNFANIFAVVLLKNPYIEHLQIKGSPKQSHKMDS